METSAILSIALSAAASLMTGLILLALRGQTTGRASLFQEQEKAQTARHAENQQVLAMQTTMLTAINGRLRAEEQAGAASNKELEGHIQGDAIIHAYVEKRLNQLELDVRGILVVVESIRVVRGGGA
jgi:hypothetical protein